MKSLKPENTLFTHITLAIAQIFLWGGSFFILAVSGKFIMKDTGWSHLMIYGTLSCSLLTAGLLSPTIGTIINKNGSSSMLKYAGIVMGAGLITAALAETYLVFLTGWIVIGASMAMGLYDALFATMGKRLGKSAEKSIIQITLISGFAPTLSWPVVSFLCSSHGWRTTFIVYGLVLIIFVYPIHYFVFRFRNTTEIQASEINPPEASFSKNPTEKVFSLILLSFTLGAVLMTAISIHLIDILQDSGMSKTTAVGIAALLGPSQVCIRILDLIMPKKTPVTTAVFSALTILGGLLLLYFYPAAGIVGAVLYGLGNGMRSILKGTLPLFIYGRENFASVMGKLAQLPLIAQASTPFICAFIIQNFGTAVLLEILLFLALCNISAVLWLQNTVNQLR